MAEDNSTEQQPVPVEPNFTFHWSRQLAFSPAYLFIMEGYVDMVRRKLTHECMEFTNHSKVAYVRDGERIVAAQMYVTDKLGRAFTHFIYVDPMYRGYGLAVKVFEFLEKCVRKELGNTMVAIYTSAVEENGSMRRVLEKTGREAFTIRSAKFYPENNGS